MIQKGTSPWSTVVLRTCTRTSRLPPRRNCWCGRSARPAVPNAATSPSATRWALLSGLGFLILFGIRCNMGVAIIAMVSNRTISTVTGAVLVSMTSRQRGYTLNDELLVCSWFAGSCLCRSRNLTGMLRPRGSWKALSSGVTSSRRYRVASWPPAIRPTSEPVIKISFSTMFTARLLQIWRC